MRVAWLAALFILELVAISVWLDAASLNRGGLLTRLMQDWGAVTLRATVTFASLFLFFGFHKAEADIRRISNESPPVDINQRLLLGHGCALAVFGALSSVLFGGAAPGLRSDAAAIAWIGSGLLGIALAALAFVPLRIWSAWVQATGKVWIWAAAAAVGACSLGGVFRRLWIPAAHVTFALVQRILGFWVEHVTAAPATLTIGTPRFQVEIAPQCSGLEGVGLMLVFGVVWLWISRRDLRFPQAFLLVPGGMAVAFLLNSVRIAALILIGNAGAEGIALGGFHSQAGWIAFNAVALGIALAPRRLSWFAVQPEKPAQATVSTENPTAGYLIPFLAIMAAAMISRAFAGQVEWLYPLRLLAAGVAIWYFRRRYADLNWKISWFGPACGVVAFFLWIALDRVVPSAGNPAGFSVGRGLSWTMWLTLRTLGAVVTVPIAEELAFRGFLLRRLVAGHFDTVDFRTVPLLPVLLSSLAFALMHGNRWFAGFSAGVLYALVVRRRGSFGDAVAAHSVTNALLALWVLTLSDWRFW